MDPLRVALLQLASCGHDQAAALAKGDSFCRRAAQRGAEIALFPEMWNVGYTFFDPEEEGALERWRELAVTQEEGFFRHFRALASELEMAIALTYLERWEGRPRNTVALIDRQGEVVLTYAKVHTCDFDAEVLLTAGEEFPVCELHTSVGPVLVGAMICYDREFPESARILMLGGAELILTPNACTLEGNRLAQFRTRAYENMVGVAMANYAPPRANGHSVAFDGRAFDADGEYREMLIVEAGDEEDVYMAQFDLQLLRTYRERETWGDAFRRPSLYGALVTRQARAPFVRAQARR